MSYSSSYDSITAVFDFLISILSAFSLHTVGSLFSITDFFEGKNFHKAVITLEEQPTITEL